MANYSFNFGRWLKRLVDLGGGEVAEVVAVVNADGSPVLGDSIELGATSLAALETVSIANFPATQPVSLTSVPTHGVISGSTSYETVAASQTDQVLGGAGAAGDYLELLLCVVSAAATSTVSIKDGAGSLINVLPANVGSGTGIGTYPIPIGLTSASGAWSVTTGAGVSVIASGKFTA